MANTESLLKNAVVGEVRPDAEGKLAGVYDAYSCMRLRNEKTGKMETYVVRYTIKQNKETGKGEVALEGVRRVYSHKLEKTINAPNGTQADQYSLFDVLADLKESGRQGGNKGELLMEPVQKNE